jgi:hypothetical protein
MWAGAEIKISLPKRGESAAISDIPKLAALCYDRVYGTVESEDDKDYIPDSIRFSGATETELQAKAVIDYGDAIFSWMKSELIRENMKESVDKLRKDVPVNAAIYAIKMMRDCYSNRFNTDELLMLFQKRIAKDFARAYEIPVVPIFQHSGISDFLYFGGEREAVWMTLHNIHIPDEKLLEWSQILEFRKDEDAKRKYRKLLYWLDKEMIGKSQSFVEESISINLEEYEIAMKKHGLKTIVATVEQALDGRIITGASSAVGALTLSGYPIFGILAGAGLIIGKIAVQLAKAKISFDDVEIGMHSEISWIYKLKQS